MSSIVAQKDFDVQSLIDQWLKDEQDGDQFPVDFDIAWQIAGYSTKGNAKRKLVNSGYFDDSAFIISDKCLLHKGYSGSTKQEVIKLTCDAFKEFCMLSKSEVGKATRKYFIEAEKKWKLVEQINPQFAQEIELILAKQQLALIEKEKEELRIRANESEIRANESSAKLISVKVDLQRYFPEDYQVVIEGKPMSEVKKFSPVSETKIEVHSPNSPQGINLTYLMSELGCDRIKSGRFSDKTRKQVKELLKDFGIDLDTGIGAVTNEIVVQQLAIPKERKDELINRLTPILQSIKPNAFIATIENLYNNK